MSTAETREVIFGHGHENILATHKTTLEFTKHSYLSKKGDCIVAVSTDKALVDLAAGFKENLRKPNAVLTITIEAAGITEHVHTHGSPRLILTHPTDAVVRKSDFCCSRTLAIHSDKAACELSRELVEKLMNPKQKVKITLTVHI